MEKWVVFASHWKLRKLLHMLLTMFCWAKLLLLKKVWEAFWVNPCLPGWFLACVILGCFVKFLDDPYYEPLLWFMIVRVVSCHSPLIIQSMTDLQKITKSWRGLNLGLQSDHLSDLFKEGRMYIITEQYSDAMYRLTYLACM